jgi:ketol-acid reductoisomerase
MQLADVSARLTAIETGRSAKDMATELEHEKELLALKLEMTTKEAMEKVGHDFLKA